jgi:hypothetical protein
VRSTCIFWADLTPLSPKDLTTLEDTMRALGALLITEMLLVFLVPVCGSFCSVPVVKRGEDGDARRSHLRRCARSR